MEGHKTPNMAASAQKRKVAAGEAALNQEIARAVGGTGEVKPVQPKTSAQSLQGEYAKQSSAQTGNQSAVQQPQTVQQQQTVQKPQSVPQQAAAPQQNQAQATQRTTSATQQYTYDKNIDYSALMQRYASEGNYGQAAVLEQQRNAKIDAEGLPYEKTNTYAAWLPGGANYVPGYYVQYSEQTDKNLSDLSPIINQMYDAADRQIRDNINYETQNAADQLQRAFRDAQPQYESAIAQQLLETKQAQDARALRNQINGDRGGIGSAQIDSIGNTGAKNREAIAQQQRQLATDTARQLADLRARGKYQEATELLKSSQQRLSALYNEQVRLQQEESQKKELLASLGSQYMSAGIMPSADMLAALGIDEATAQRYVDLINAQKEESGGSSGGGGGGNGSYLEDQGGELTFRLNEYTMPANASEVSGAALDIANRMARIDSDDKKAYFREAILNARAAGTITMNDAAYLARAIGYSVEDLYNWVYNASLNGSISEETAMQWINGLGHYN